MVARFYYRAIHLIIFIFRNVVTEGKVFIEDSVHMAVVLLNTLITLPVVSKIKSPSAGQQL